MAKSEDLKAFILDQLSEIPEISVKNMFGGVGFFQAGKMFAMIGGGAFRLKVGESNRAQFEAAGMTAYMSSAKKKGMPYYEVPAEILENKDDISKWALQSIELAHA